MHTPKWISLSMMQMARAKYLKYYATRGSKCTLYRPLPTAVCDPTSNPPPQVILQGLHNMNRAIHQDVVAIQLLPREQWVAPSSVVLLDEREAKDEDDTEEEEKEKAVRRSCCCCYVLSCSSCSSSSSSSRIVTKCFVEEENFLRGQIWSFSQTGWCQTVFCID